MQIIFTTGDFEAAISIMREAAQWQIGLGDPLWELDYLTRENITNPAEEFIVAWVVDGSDRAQRSDGAQRMLTRPEGASQAAACCLLSYEDKPFWPDIPAGSSGFLHKIAVRRKFAGQGLAARIIEHAEQACLARGVTMLRLDTDLHRPKLRRLYENLGFRALRPRMMLLEELNFVPIEVMLYEKELR